MDLGAILEWGYDIITDILPARLICIRSNQEQVAAKGVVYVAENGILYRPRFQTNYVSSDIVRGLVA